MSEVLSYIVGTLTVLLLIPLGYLLLLTFSGLLYRWLVTGKAPSGPPLTRIAVLVPAHNEEVVLPKLLESIAATGYPEELLKVFIVADNCTDGTAEVARKYPCEVFERQNDELIGKGHALEWLLEQISDQSEWPSAYVFLDADCEVSTNFLHMVDARFQRGEMAVQAYYTTANPTETWVSSLRHLALILMHHTRPSGREVLGLSCGIFGTGMALHRSVIEHHGWKTHGLAEDVEYFMKLTEDDVRVSFAREAQVVSAMPASLKASKTQNERWEKGRLSVARRYFVPFVLGGILSRSAVKIDAGIQQALPPFSLVGLASVALFVGSLFTGSAVVVGLATAAVIALALYVVIGIAAARPPAKALFAIAYVPWYVLWKLALYVRSMKPGGQKWLKTERPDQGPQA